MQVKCLAINSLIAKCVATLAKYVTIKTNHVGKTTK